MRWVLANFLFTGSLAQDMSPLRSGREQLPGAGDTLQGACPEVVHSNVGADDQVVDVLEVRSCPGSAAAITRAVMWTAIPPTSPSRSSISPVCSPARIHIEPHNQAR
jgi:hypothetical protein